MSSVAAAGPAEAAPLPPLRGLPPVVGAGARVLVLGSMPGEESLRQRQYYGHPRNHFWRLMEDLLGIPHRLPYCDRTAALRASGLALWDVLATCVRKGSLDAHIQRDSVQVNDVAGLLASQPQIERVLFNGVFAETVYRTHLRARVEALRPIQTIRLPSTSPANASRRYEQKLEAWRNALAGSRVNPGMLFPSA